MKDYLKSCTMCPRKCKVNRYKSSGFCKANDKIKVAHVSIHRYEEPCISIKNGSGTVFFSLCNMSCKFCQNYKISKDGYGKEISIEYLADIFLNLQDKGADNINLVSPTIYALCIRDAIKIAKEKGLKIPIIYNTNGFENVDTLRLLDGYIDIYLTDFKYATSFISEKYSHTKDYPCICVETVRECLRQIPKNIYDKDGKMLKGVIIRHLVLPNHILNTKNVLKIISDEFGKDVCLSIMFQYFPAYKAKKLDSLNRKVNYREYKEVNEYIDKFGFTNGYSQIMEENEEKYVPNFNIDTV